MTRHYFVDYDVYSLGHPLTFGQLSMTWVSGPGGTFDPEALLRAIRRRAAERHCVADTDIRIRSMSKL